jgi:hypothetical protein
LTVVNVARKTEKSEKLNEYTSVQQDAAIQYSKSEGFGNAFMTQGKKKEPILQMGTDKVIPRHVYGKPATVRVPNRSE